MVREQLDVAGVVAGTYAFADSFKHKVPFCGRRIVMQPVQLIVNRIDVVVPHAEVVSGFVKQN